MFRNSSFYLIFLGLISFIVHVWSTLHAWSNAGLDMSSPRSHAVIALINDEILYQFGGANAFYTAETSIIKLNLSDPNPIWRSLSFAIPSPSLMCAHTCTTIIHDRYIYMFSLYDHLIKPNDDWHIFDAVTETWQSIVKPSTYSSMDPLGCIVSDSNELIYQIGGAYTWLYNTSSDSWSSLSMSSITQSRQSCVYYTNFEDEGDVIFSIGGCDSCNPGIYKYVVNLNSWENIEITGPSITRIDTDAILATDDKTYVIGGDAGSTMVNIFDPHSNTVSFAPNLDSTLSCGAAASVMLGNEIYVFGGWRDDSLMCCPIKGSQKSNILTKTPTLYPTLDPSLSPTEATTFPTIQATFDPITSNPTTYASTLDTTEMQPNIAEETQTYGHEETVQSTYTKPTFDPITSNPTTYVSTLDTEETVQSAYTDGVDNNANKINDPVVTVALIVTVVVFCIIIGYICLLRKTRIKDNAYSVKQMELQSVSSVVEENQNDKKKVIYLDEGRDDPKDKKEDNNRSVNDNVTKGSLLNISDDAFVVTGNDETSKGNDDGDNTERNDTIARAGDHTVGEQE